MAMPECIMRNGTSLYVFQPVVESESKFEASAIFLSVFIVVLGAYTMLANGFVIWFYRDKMRDIVPLLYTSIALNDFITGFTGVLHSITFTVLLTINSCNTAPLLALILPASLLTMLCVRVSVFYNLLLTICRTINIVKPFARISRRLLVVLLVLIPLLPWLPVIVHQMTVRFPRDDYMDFKARILTSSSLVGDALVRLVFGDNHYVSVALCLILPFVVPSVICVVSLVIQLNELLFDNTSLGASSSGPDHDKVRAAKSIFLLTLVFTVCNTASAIFWCVVCFDANSDILVQENAIWVYITSSTIPFLNSALTPTILVARGVALRKRVVGIVTVSVG